jgi:hypothetical protein
MAAENVAPPDLATGLALRPREGGGRAGAQRTSFPGVPRLPHVRAGGAVLIPVEALRRWLEEQARRQPERIAEIVAEGLRAVRAR